LLYKVSVDTTKVSVDSIISGVYLAVEVIHYSIILQWISGNAYPEMSGYEITAV